MLAEITPDWVLSNKSNVLTVTIPVQKNDDFEVPKPENFHAPSARGKKLVFIIFLDVLVVLNDSLHHQSVVDQ